MKKILFAIIALVGFAEAQSQVTFRPGLRAGANFSHFTKGDELRYYDDSFVNGNNNFEFKSKTDFYVGFYGALRLTRYYTLQPEITYSRQGSKFETLEVYYDSSDMPNYFNRSGQVDVSYLSIAVINKFTFSDKFYVQVGPTIDFVVDKSGTPLVNRNNDNYYYYDSDPTDVDLAFVAGLGFNFTKNLGIEARVKKGIIPVVETDDNDHTNVNFSIGATYTFDLK